MLKQFGRDIWIADGPDAVVAGFHYPTQIAVIRLTGGELFSANSASPSSSVALRALR